MKSTVERLSPTRVKLNVEVPFEELEPNFKRAYAALADQVRIPGFRPGKAPAKLIEARVGREAVLEQVINEALPQKYNEAIEDANLKPITNPEIDLSELEYGESVSFTAEVDVRPELDLPDWNTIAVEVEAVEVTDEAVDEQLSALQKRFGTLSGVDRPVQDGDFVSIDLSATVDGEEVEEAATEGLSHEVGSGELIDGLDEALIGLQADETKTFPSTLVAGDFADKEAQVTVTVQSVKERELPELDDDFAQLASEFDTIEELRDSLRGRVADSKKSQQVQAANDAVLEKLLEVVDVPVPTNIVDAEVENSTNQLLTGLGGDEEKLNEFLAAQDTDREKYEAEARESTEKNIKTQLLLDAIADKADTHVSQEEFTEAVLFQAQRYGIAPQEFVEHLQKSDQIGSIFADVRRSKALGSVVREATITDSAGDTVDVSAFFPAEEPHDHEH